MDGEGGVSPSAAPCLGRLPPQKKADVLFGLKRTVQTQIGLLSSVKKNKQTIKTKIKFDIPNEMVTEKELVLLESMESMLITNLWAVRCVYLCLYRWVGCHFNPVMGLTRVP